MRLTRALKPREPLYLEKEEGGEGGGGRDKRETKRIEEVEGRNEERKVRMSAVNHKRSTAQHSKAHSIPFHSIPAQHNTAQHSTAHRTAQKVQETGS